MLAKLTKEEVEEVLDLYAERASLQYISFKTDIPIEDLRVLFSDKEMVETALKRRANSFALWFSTGGLDTIKDIVTSSKSTTNQKINAIRLAKDIVSRMPVLGKPREKGEKSPMTKTLTVEAALKELDGKKD